MLLLNISIINLSTNCKAILSLLIVSHCRFINRKMFMSVYLYSHASEQKMLTNSNILFYTLIRIY